MQEQELKVELSKPDLDRLAGGFAADDLCVDAASTKSLRKAQRA